MRATWCVCAALLIFGGAFSGPAVCADAGSGKLIPPPAINVPAGGVVVTEINVSDDDVLGVVKQATPFAAKLATLFLAGQGGNLGAAEMVILDTLNSPGLVESLQGLKGLRIIIAQYPSARPSAKQFMEQFDRGVGKLGGFSKVLGDIAFFPGAAGIYAQPGNAGYIAFTYDPNGGVMYAARTVGFVDVPKLLQTVENAIAALMSNRAGELPPGGGQPEDEKGMSGSDKAE